ncbi:hypothetical protein Tco_0702628 [Tanacetum coccineum]|uniref:Retrovirus-related Pol polyprotein from transposon TNT 1-94-like beta-barrel domain-containing protein n=1 Tax=Tanacetum coccineum TaxID=301880 RepID=A0ABQ4XXV4_9ASTR
MVQGVSTEDANQEVHLVSTSACLKILKPLVTLVIEKGDEWTIHTKEDEQENYAIEAYSSSSANTEGTTSHHGPDKEIDDSQFTYGPKQSNPSESNTRSSDFTSCESNSSEETHESMPESVVNEPKVVSQPKVLDYVPIKDCDFHEKRMAKQAEMNKRKCKGTGQRENRPVWNNANRVNHQNQFVPTALLTRTCKIQVNTARASSTNNVNTVRASSTKDVSTARHNFNCQAVPTNAARKVHTVKPIVNNDYPQRALKNKGIVDSGCSRHMTGNKAYLAKYQDYNVGPVAFRSSKGYITGKGKIKTGKLDFEDVCFVKELQHFNLFSVSHICDKKNKVLFTDTECLVLSPDFKLLDENQPVRSENQANKHAGPKEANNNAGTQDNIDAENSKMEAKSAQDYFVLPIWSSYTSTVKSSEAKNEGEKSTENTDLNSNEKPVDQEEQAFLDELERLKRQEKEANDAADALRKEFAQNIEDLLLQAGAARASSTNIVNTASTPVSTASPSGGLSFTNLTNTDQDDLEIPDLEDSYDNPNDGIFTNASYGIFTNPNDGIFPLCRTHLSDLLLQSLFLIPIQRVLVGIMKVTIQAKEIKDLKAQIKKLKKKARPVITHHKAWMKSVSMKTRLVGNKSMQKESVSKQGRKIAKSKSTAHNDQAFDDPDDFGPIDYMETKDAHNEKGISTEYQVNIVKPDEGTDKPKVSTDKIDEGTAELKNGNSDENATPIVFRDDETIAEFRKGLNEAERKFAQLANDEEIAKKVQEEWKQKRKTKSWLKRIATKITIAARREISCTTKSRAINRSRKPPTRTQLRNQMMTYLKHVGGKKHSDLKTKNFKEIQVLYEKVKRSDENFTAIGSAEDERRIKVVNKKATGIKMDDSIKEESKEEETTDEDKEVDYEILDKKYPIIERKTEYLGTKPQFGETKRLEEINLNVVIRGNGQRRYFRVHTLMTETRLVMYMLVEKKYHLRKKVLLQMLELKFGNPEENRTMAIGVDLKFVKKLMQIGT